MQKMENTPLLACFCRYFHRGTQKIAEIDKGNRIACLSLMFQESKQRNAESSEQGFYLGAFMNTFIEARRKMQEMIRPIVFACLSLMF